MSHTERVGQRSTRSGTSKHKCGRWRYNAPAEPKFPHQKRFAFNELRKSMRLMRHQHRYCHGTKDTASDAAENEFAQARVPVAAHHHQVGPAVGDVVENDVADRDVALGDALDLGGNAVTREMLGHVGAGDLVVLALLGDDEDVD